jgi:hypothetical protein
MPGKIFISHAHKDKKLTDKFVEMLHLGCGLSDKNIFYTSEVASGIPLGENFIDYINKNLTDAAVVIFILSKNFYNSVFCVSELGATWGLKKPIFPILVDLSVDEIKDTLQVVQKGFINNEDDLDTLRDAIELIYLESRSTVKWKKARNIFLEEVETLIAALPKTSKVDSSVYKELMEQNEQTMELLAHKEAEIDQLKRTIEQIKTTQARNELEKIIVNDSSTPEKFQELILNVESAFKGLPYIVRQAMYSDYLGQAFFPEDHFDFDDAIELGGNSYLSYNAETRSFRPVAKRSSVKIAFKSLNLLKEFLEGVILESEFGQWICNEYDFEPKELLENKEFWVKHMYEAGQADDADEAGTVGNVEDIPF